MWTGNIYLKQLQQIIIAQKNPLGMKNKKKQNKKHFILSLLFY